MGNPCPLRQSLYTGTGRNQKPQLSQWAKRHDRSSAPRSISHWTVHRSLDASAQNSPDRCTRVLRATMRDEFGCLAHCGTQPLREVSDGTVRHMHASFIKVVPSSLLLLLRWSVRISSSGERKREKEMETVALERRFLLCVFPLFVSNKFSIQSPGLTVRMQIEGAREGSHQTHSPPLRAGLRGLRKRGVLARQERKAQAK